MAMNDLLTDELVTLATARTTIIPSKDGRPVNPSTVWRWIHKGVEIPGEGKVRLEVIYIGKTPMTSREAVERFFHRVVVSLRSRER